MVELDAVRALDLGGNFVQLAGEDDTIGFQFAVDDADAARTTRAYGKCAVAETGRSERE